MKTMTSSLLVFPLLLSVFVDFSPALDQVDSMRCGSKLVMIEDSKVDVLSKCGEPAMKEKVVRNYSVKKSKCGSSTGNRSKTDDQWIYNLGPQDFIYTLTFEGVALKEIGRGGRGTRQ